MSGKRSVFGKILILDFLFILTQTTIFQCLALYFWDTLYIKLILTHNLELKKNVKIRNILAGRFFLFTFLKMVRLEAGLYGPGCGP
jgi:hypothetical protein